MAGALLAVWSGMAAADVRIAAILSLTGPAASLGVPEKNAIELMPKSAGGQALRIDYFDDSSVPARAAELARSAASGGYDVIVGPTTSAAGMAVVPVAGTASIPVISLAASAAQIAPMDDSRKWVFKMPQSDNIMAERMVADMKASGIGKLAIIRSKDAYGEGWENTIRKLAKEAGIDIATASVFVSSSTRVNDQVKAAIAGSPDGILIAAAGLPSLLPQVAAKRFGFKGKIFQTHGVANADFLRYGGRLVNGTRLPVGPVLVYSGLAEDHPARQEAERYTQTYEKAYGTGSASTFGAHAWDGMLLLSAAIGKIPKTTASGTPEYRAALRNAIEKTSALRGAHGTYSMTDKDHNGMDPATSAVMVEVDEGKWKALK